MSGIDGLDEVFCLLKMATEFLTKCQAFQDYRELIAQTYPQIRKQIGARLCNSQILQYELANVVSYSQLNDTANALVMKTLTDPQCIQNMFAQVFTNQLTDAFHHFESDWLAASMTIITMELMMNGLTQPIKLDETEPDSRLGPFNAVLDQGLEILAEIHANCYSYTRAVRRIQRWWRRQYYHPGRIGYRRAQDHFTSLIS